MAQVPFVLGAGEGAAFWTLGGRFTLKFDGDASDGRVSMLEALAWRTAEPPLHIHHREDEAWYILEGQLTFYVADEAHLAGPGTLVYAPMGIAHTFTVDVEPSRVLVLATPAGFEHFALELGTPATSDEPPAEGLGVPEPEILGPVAERYGIEVIGPPRRVSHPDGA